MVDRAAGRTRLAGDSVGDEDGEWRERLSASDRNRVKRYIFERLSALVDAPAEQLWGRSEVFEDREFQLAGNRGDYVERIVVRLQEVEEAVKQQQQRWQQQHAETGGTAAALGAEESCTVATSPRGSWSPPAARPASVPTHMNAAAAARPRSGSVSEASTAPAQPRPRGPTARSRAASAHSDGQERDARRLLRPTSPGSFSASSVQEHGGGRARPASSPQAPRVLESPSSSPLSGYRALQTMPLGATFTPQQSAALAMALQAFHHMGPDARALGFGALPPHIVEHLGAAFPNDPVVFATLAACMAVCQGDQVLHASQFLTALGAARDAAARYLVSKSLSMAGTGWTHAADAPNGSAASAAPMPRTGMDLSRLGIESRANTATEAAWRALEAFQESDAARFHHIAPYLRESIARRYDAHSQQAYLRVIEQILRLLSLRRRHAADSPPITVELVERARACTRRWIQVYLEWRNADRLRQSQQTMRTAGQGAGTAAVPTASAQALDAVLAASMASAAPPTAAGNASTLSATDMNTAVESAVPRRGVGGERPRLFSVDASSGDVGPGEPRRPHPGTTVGRTAADFSSVLEQRVTFAEQQSRRALDEALLLQAQQMRASRDSLGPVLRKGRADALAVQAAAAAHRPGTAMNGAEKESMTMDRDGRPLIAAQVTFESDQGRCRAVVPLKRGNAALDHGATSTEQLVARLREEAQRVAAAKDDRQYELQWEVSRELDAAVLRVGVSVAAAAPETKAAAAASLSLPTRLVIYALPSPGSPTGTALMFTFEPLPPTSWGRARVQQMVQGVLERAHKAGDAAAARDIDGPLPLWSTALSAAFLMETWASCVVQRLSAADVLGTSPLTTTTTTNSPSAHSDGVAPGSRSSSASSLSLPHAALNGASGHGEVASGERPLKVPRPAAGDERLDDAPLIADRLLDEWKRACGLPLETSDSP